jgi:hypothetical protein
VTAADVPLMQGLAQRVTATRPDLISAGASYGELAWIWGKGYGRRGLAAPAVVLRRRSGGVGLAFLPHQVRRNDGSVTDVTGAALSYQVHPGHTELVDEVIEFYDGVAAGATHATVVCLGAPGHPRARGGVYYSVGFRELSRDAPLIKTATAG